MIKRELWGDIHVKDSLMVSLLKQERKKERKTVSGRKYRKCSSFAVPREIDDWKREARHLSAEIPRRWPAECVRNEQENVTRKGIDRKGDQMTKRETVSIENKKMKKLLDDEVGNIRLPPQWKRKTELLEWLRGWKITHRRRTLQKKLTRRCSWH